MVQRHPMRLPVPASPFAPNRSSSSRVGIGPRLTRPVSVTCQTHGETERGAWLEGGRCDFFMKKKGKERGRFRLGTQGGECRLPGRGGRHGSAVRASGEGARRISEGAGASLRHARCVCWALGAESRGLRASRQARVQVEHADVPELPQHAQARIAHGRVGDIQHRERPQQAQVRHARIAHRRVGEVELRESADGAQRGHAVV